MQRYNKWGTTDIVVFIMLWVYFTLNARYLNFSGSHIWRWILPIILIISTIVDRGSYITQPPPFLLWFVIAVLPSVVFGIDVKTSIQKFIAFILILYGCYVFFMGSYGTEDLRWYFYIFARVAVIFQILNILFIVAGIGWDGSRAMGITTNSNTLGIYSNIAFWAAVYLTTLADKTWKKVFWEMITVSAAFTALLSGSRSAFIVIALNLIALGFIRYYRSIAIIPFVILISIITYLLLNGKLEFLGITALKRLEEQGTDRGVLWEHGINLWKQHQIFGCGYALSSMLNFVRGLQFHNSYLSYLIECGVWGAGVLGFGFLGVGIQILRNVKRCINGSGLHPFLLACFIILDIALTAYGESFLFAVGSTEGFTFWFLLAWIMAYMNHFNYDSYEE